jgi:hypothetical protein
MRLLLAIVILAALGWSGWWWWHASMRERAVEAWLAERRAAGWAAEAEEVRVTGFPNRIDTVVTGLELADPAAGWSWSAPEFQFLSLSYKPHHVIAVWPGEQVVATPYDRLRLTGEVLRGSVIFEPNARLALDQATIEIAGLRIVSELGWEMGIGKAILATRQAGEGAPPFAHDLAFDAEGLAPPRAVAEGIDVAGVLPDALETLALDAMLVFDRPWDRVAVESDNPVLEEMLVRDASAAWGRLDLRGQGELTADPEGYAEGRIDLRARNWSAMIDLAENAGALGAGLAGAMRGGFDLIARLSGDGDVIKLPLDFEGGQTRLGPIPLGPAPRIARR